MSKYVILKTEDHRSYETLWYTKKATTESLAEAFILRGVYQSKLDESSDILDKGKTAVVAQIIEMSDVELVTKVSQAKETEGER